MNKKDYSPDWHDIIRPAILKRDSFKCQHCGVRHKNYYLFQPSGIKIKIEQDEYIEYLQHGLDARRIYLQVAHLDNNKSNNDDTNLLSLCNTCHLKNDRAHSQMMRLAKKKAKLS